LRARRRSVPPTLLRAVLDHSRVMRVEFRFGVGRDAVAEWILSRRQAAIFPHSFKCSGRTAVALALVFVS